MMLGNEQETINNVNHFVEMENQSNLNKGSATIQWMVGAAILAKNGNHQSFTNYCVNMFKRFPVADEIIGERIEFFVDEEHRNETKKFRGKKVFHPKDLNESNHTILPYGESGVKIQKRFQSMYNGSFGVL